MPREERVTPQPGARAPRVLCCALGRWPRLHLSFFRALGDGGRSAGRRPHSRSALPWGRPKESPYLSRFQRLAVNLCGGQVYAASTVLHVGGSVPQEQAHTPGLRGKD